MDAETAQTPAGEDRAQRPAFEQVVQQLEGIVRKLESGEPSLEQSLKLFEEGVRLSREGTRHLEEAERRIEVQLASGEREALDLAEGPR